MGVLNWRDRLDDRHDRQVIRRAQACGVRKPTLRSRFGIDAFNLIRLTILFAIGVFALVIAVVELWIGGIVVGLILTGLPVLVLLVGRWSQKVAYRSRVGRRR